MDILFGASIIASFLAGMVALFAPCCITVLLPAYLAAAFRERRRILLMTFVFFSGIAAVLIPIGMGAAFLARLFQSFHMEMYIIGGTLMIVMGAMSLAGRGISLFPMSRAAVANHSVGGGMSVFVLGVFSGAATSCCAPVLMGALTLAVISGTFWKALVVTFAYVFGMTLPLFLAAFLYDKFHIENSPLVKGKIVRLRVGRKTLSVHSTNLFAGLLFIAIGGMLNYLAFSGNAFFSPAYQVAVGEGLNRWSQRMFETLRVLPDAAWGVLIIGAFLILLAVAVRQRKNHIDETRQS